MPVYGLLGFMPLLFIYIRQFLKLRINSRDFMNIYIYIYDSCRLRLSCEWASYPGAFIVKSYTLVYFSSKASLLMIKNHNKYQSINLIGLAHVEKAYSKNRLIIVRIEESCDLC